MAKRTRPRSHSTTESEPGYLPAAVGYGVLLSLVVIVIGLLVAAGLGAFDHLAGAGLAPSSVGASPGGGVQQKPILEQSQSPSSTSEASGSLAIPLLVALVLVVLVSLVLHGKPGLVFFADYTDTTMTFLGPIAVVIPLILLRSSEPLNAALAIGSWFAIATVLFFGIRTSYVNNPNAVFAVLAFISKYILCASCLLLLYVLLAGEPTRKEGESAEAYERRRKAEQRSSQLITVMIAAIAAFFVRRLVKERRFSSASTYFSLSWSRRTFEVEEADTGTCDPEENDSENQEASQEEDPSGEGGGAEDDGAEEDENREESDNSEDEEEPEDDADLDPYEVLGVSENATEAEIRQAYLQKIKEYHPDKVANLGKELRDLAESKSKEINLAYDELLKPVNAAGRD
jgi:hypothetical protein